MVVEDNRDQSSQQIGIAIQENIEKEDIQTLRLTYYKGLSSKIIGYTEEAWG